MLRWPARGRKTIYLALLVLGCGAFVLMIYGLRIWGEYSGPKPEFGDFFALWSYGKIVASHPAADVYDSSKLDALQVALGMRDGAPNPFPYPPIALLLFRPLAWLPVPTAYLVWTVGTLALFVWAVVATCSRLAICVVGVIVAPVSTSCIASGQTGFLTAALLIAGVRLAGKWPILGGVSIGLLAYKPQMAMLVPIAFIAAGHWRAVAAAGVTVLVLAAIATAAYGIGVWADWSAMLPGYLDMFDRDPVRMGLKPTVMANLQLAGVALPIAKAVQGFVTVAAAFVVWRCFRRGAGRLATAALLVGTALATPHAFIYDLPIVAASMALLIQERMVRDPVFGLGEIPHPHRCVQLSGVDDAEARAVGAAGQRGAVAPAVRADPARHQGSTLRHQSQLTNPT